MHKDKITGANKIQTSIRVDPRILLALPIMRINKSRFFEDKFIQYFKEKFPDSNNIPDKLREIMISYFQDQKKEAEYWISKIDKKKELSENQVFDILNDSFNQDRESVKIWYVKMKKGQSYLPDIFISINGNHPEITNQVLNKHQKIAKMIIESIASEEGIV